GRLHGLKGGFQQPIQDHREVPGGEARSAGRPQLPGTMQKGVIWVTMERATIILTCIGSLLLCVTSAPAKKERDLDIYSFHINSTVNSRYAITTITSRVANRLNESKEVHFQVKIPKNAFISKFKMIIEGKTYDGVVKQKEEAQEQYSQAVSQGESAGIVSSVGRTLEEFKTSVTVSALSKVTFELTYEELIKRRLGKYKLQINAQPMQPVADFKINVYINEQPGISFLEVNGGLKTKELSSAVISTLAASTREAWVNFYPTREQQTNCEGCGKNGLNGDLFIEYDVKRPKQNGEMQALKGYFVHYFAPTDIQKIPKNVVFLIDRSGSMRGKKIQQMDIISYDRDILISIGLVFSTHLSPFLNPDSSWPSKILRNTNGCDPSVMVSTAYIPPQVDVDSAIGDLYEALTQHQTQHRDTALIVARDFNSANLKHTMANFFQHITCHSRLKQEAPVQREVRRWTDQSVAALQDTLDDANWDVFRCSFNDVNMFMKEVVGFIRKLANDTVQKSQSSEHFPTRGHGWIRNALRSRSAAYNTGLATVDMDEYKAESNSVHKVVKESSLDNTPVMCLISNNNETAYLQEINNLERCCQENNLLLNVIVDSGLQHKAEAVKQTAKDQRDPNGEMRQFQTQLAMLKILGDLAEEDYFGLITFDSYVHAWNPELLQATETNLKKAKSFVEAIHAQGGETNTERIQANVKMAIGGKFPLYCLGFGFDVNFGFLEKMALENDGVARRIYEDSDADLQLQGFYEEVATPLLTDVQLKYPGAANLTQTSFRQYYNGSEIVVAGKITDNSLEDLQTEVIAISKNTNVTYQDSISTKDVIDVLPQHENFIQRLWAYLTVKQLLEKEVALKGNEKEAAQKKALDLSLKYEFVTPLTSMVVTKPQEEKTQVVHKPKEGVALSLDSSRSFHRQMAYSPPWSKFFIQGFGMSGSSYPAQAGPPGIPGLLGSAGRQGRKGSPIRLALMGERGHAGPKGKPVPSGDIFINGQLSDNGFTQVAIHYKTAKLLVSPAESVYSDGENSVKIVWGQSSSLELKNIAIFQRKNELDVTMGTMRVVLLIHRNSRDDFLWPVIHQQGKNANITGIL
ncbi:hypothetical protein QTP86_025094, partial [Hemibagrus guttatus]